MKIKDVVKFRSDLFFEGAVQLLWADQNVKRATEAARTFVFHGPRYHGVGKETGADDAYRLTDTATLAADLLSRIAGMKGQNENDNPFSLAIAGYGSGKSHFAVALTQLLRNPDSELSEQIIANIALADRGISERTKLAVLQIEKPAFVIVLDGTGNFNLANALSRAVYRSLKEEGIDDSVLRELSPRFEDAVNFVNRNYGVRLQEFEAKFPSTAQAGIISALGERDEQTFSLVDEIYVQANGAHIPLEGRESAQDLINVFCESYCGSNGKFSRLVIMFDEFGRFLEYVAERPTLAGDSALQQIFQGVQDNSGLAHFVGFIQYELKAYLARLGSRDAMHIQKYITRFDIAKKYYLSSNLETILAHLLEKTGIEILDVAFERQLTRTKNLHSLMATLLPGFKKIPVWNELIEFERVIVQGCWPLHPLATWFLTRQQDIVQTRSAITFVKNAIGANEDRDALQDESPSLIPASVIVGGEMMNEMLAVERANGGVTVDNLVATFGKYDAQLNDVERALLISVTAAKKMRVITGMRPVYDELLAELSGLDRSECQSSISRLELELGVLVWSKELQQYEIVTDAATRGQYQKELRNKIAQNIHAIPDIFVGRSKNWTDDLLQDIHPSFGQEADIPTLEWLFTAQLANERTIATAIKNAFADWWLATKPDQSKGQVIYCYVNAATDLAILQAKVEVVIGSELQGLKCAAAPVWVILLADRSNRMAQYLATLYVLEEKFEANERERYGRFIPEEREVARQGLRAVLREAIQDRVSVVSGVQMKPGRLVIEANAIFLQVYPKALPFPMDGFSSRAGNGPMDAAAIARALFGGDVNGAWLAVQLVRMQNRVRGLLGTAWGLLATDGKPKASADNAKIRDVLAVIEQAHRDSPQRTLGDDLAMLVRPPYGCNLASASILLGLFIEKSLPPRAIYFDSEATSRGNWLRAAYSANGRYLEEKILRSTTVVFLTADALTRWQLVIQQWDAEQTYKGLVSRLRDAARMRERDPLPDTLEVNYSFLADKAKKAEEELAAHQRVLDDCERRIESALRSHNVAEFLAVSDKYLAQQRVMSASPERWTGDEVAPLASQLDQVKEVIQAAVAAWTVLQTCNSPQLVQDFRNRMGRCERTLEQLDLKPLAQRVKAHTSSMISKVEQRYSFSTTLNEAADLIHSPDPVASTRVREINDRLEKAERLVNVLVLASAEMRNDESINAQVDALKKKQTTWRKIRSAMKEQYSALLETYPSSAQEANDLLLRLEVSRHQFSQTGDEDDIKERLASCLTLKNYLAELDEITGSADHVQATLSYLFEASPYFIDREQEIAVNEEDTETGADLFWINQCFDRYVLARVTAAKARSSGWTRNALAELKGLQMKTDQLFSAEPLERYATLPVFLCASDSAMVVMETTRLRELYLAVREKARSETIRLWIESIEEQGSDSGALTKEKCSDILSQFDRHPLNLQLVEQQRLADLRLRVERRLDEIDISDLIGRVIAMPESKRKQLLEQLSSLYQE